MATVHISMTFVILWLLHIFNWGATEAASGESLLNNGAWGDSAASTCRGCRLKWGCFVRTVFFCNVRARAGSKTALLVCEHSFFNNRHKHANFVAILLNRTHPFGAEVCGALNCLEQTRINMGPTHMCVSKMQFWPPQNKLFDTHTAKSHK